MDLNLIECFYAVAKAGSLSKVATDMEIEQSTLTRYINRLEASIGVKLFHRSGRGMVLNEKGKLFFNYAEAVIQAAENARQAAANLAAVGPSQIIIAAQPTIAQVTFAEIGHELRREFPSAKIRFAEGLGHQIISWLQEGKVDAAILYLPENASMLTYEHLVQEPLYLVGPADAQEMGVAVCALNLLDFPLVLPSTTHGLRTLSSALAMRYGKELKIAVECNGSTFLTRRLVQLGHGYTILPLASVMDEVTSGTLRAAKIDDPETVRSVVLATATGRPQAQHFWRINQIIKLTIAELVAGQKWPGVNALG